jgi:Transcriptional activator, adenine-specific DNA methyltransferase
MSDAEIASLPIGALSHRNAHLYLWVPNALLPNAVALMDSWGFKYKTNLVWVKTGSDGLPDRRGVGFYFRNATELLLFGVKGKLRTRAPARSLTNVIRAERRQHSRKPDSVYQLLEQCSYGPYLELFARTRKRGWHQLGDEIGTFTLESSNRKLRDQSQRPAA